MIFKGLTLGHWASMPGGRQEEALEKSVMESGLHSLSYLQTPEGGL